MSDAYPEYIEEFSIEISDFNPIGPTAHIPLPETLPKRNNGIINTVKPLCTDIVYTDIFVYR